MLVQCISVETMKDTLQSAMDKGIPVGIYPYDTSVGATTYFGYDEYVWGYSLGEAAAEWTSSKLGGKAQDPERHHLPRRGRDRPLQRLGRRCEHPDRRGQHRMADR